jgi:hypothetical protein
MYSTPGVLKERQLSSTAERSVVNKEREVEDERKWKLGIISLVQGFNLPPEMARVMIG